MRVVAENYEHTHAHIHTGDNYRNPRCACVPRVNKLNVDVEARSTTYY